MPTPPAKMLLSYVNGLIFSYEIFYVTRCYGKRHGKGWLIKKPINLTSWLTHMKPTNLTNIKVSLD